MLKHLEMFFVKELAFKSAYEIVLGDLMILISQITIKCAKRGLYAANARRGMNAHCSLPDSV
jgi:hypothetical protein